MLSPDVDAHTRLQRSQAFSSEDARWEAVRRRDRAADGVFYCAVRTTGVYCRPSCAGRPLRKNVMFYATAAEAERAGFRPCKRCRPTAMIEPGSRACAFDRRAGVVARLGADRIRSRCSRLRHDRYGADAARMRQALTASYEVDENFPQQVVMARHGFGRGEYKYFSYPLPELVAVARVALSAPCGHREWLERGMSMRALSPAHAIFSTRATPRGRTGRRRCCCDMAGRLQLPAPGLYGEHVFPLQVAFLCRGRATISRAANSCSPSSAHACSRAPRWCRCARAAA